MTEDHFNAGARFRHIVKGKNFMTPDIVEYGFIKDDVVYELAEGTDFTNSLIYGVTLVQSDPKTWNGEQLHDVSKVFQGKDAKKKAKDYIAEMRLD